MLILFIDWVMHLGVGEFKTHFDYKRKPIYKGVKIEQSKAKVKKFKMS